MRKVSFYYILIALVIVFGLFLFGGGSHTISFSDESPEVEAEKVVKKNPNGDIGFQSRLANPPEVIKGIYSTSWSAGNEKRLTYFLDLFKTTELNAVVIDIKDFTGIISYEPDVDLVREYEAYENRIPKINSLIKRFHDNGVYVIGRVAVFEDNQLAKVRPDLALKRKSTGQVWTTNKGLAWVDTASKDVWDYNIAIANDALARGFDEVNFDYIRFPSDGPLSDISYPFFSTSTLKQTAVADFFKYVRRNVPEGKISADVFGDVAHARQDIGIGQVLEDTFDNFDYVAPMTYPSHYARGFLGYQAPALYPYEIMKYSIDHAVTRVAKFYEPASATSTISINTKIRPWIQDFDLGADYTPEMVKAQIRAIDDSVNLNPNSLISAESVKNGWILWNPSNRYSRQALEPSEI